MSAPEIVLFSIAELGSGAHEAHLRALGRRASRIATVHEVALVGLRMYGSRIGRDTLARQRSAAREALSGGFVVRPCEPRSFTLRWSAFALARAVNALCASPRPIIHCRGDLATCVAVRARDAGLSCRILYDVRGDRSAEVRAFGGEALPEVVEGREAEACRGADALACVSNPLRERLAELHGVDAEIFPCAADTDVFRPDEEARAELRAHLGVGDRFLLGFVGSAAGWQRPDAVAALGQRIRSLREGSLLLILTPDVERWIAALEAVGLSVDTKARPRPGSGAHVRCVPHAEVPKWLAALDATALLRDRDAINRVASPIKFGESLACGVPVLLTEGIGDASGLVASRDLGAVFADPLLGGDGDAARLVDFIDRQAADRLGLAARCRAAACESWSWDEQMPRWTALHERLRKDDPR